MCRVFCNYNYLPTSVMVVLVAVTIVISIIVVP